ncbi:MAG: dihydropteroate synthase [bacterium]|tara:strand:- start:7661 stop:8491 length:831 start_codon:yes stop_codon:yes gene_type:complete
MLLKVPSKTFRSNDFPLVVGVLNLTPDSFYDGGKYNDLRSIYKLVEKYLDEGADIIDIGAESTKPGSKRVSYEEEKRRLFPIVNKIIKKYNPIISLDTMKSEIAKIGLDLGVELINDVTGFMYDESMPKVIANYKCGLIINHTTGLPQIMQKKTNYKNIIKDIIKFFESILDTCKKNNIPLNSIVLDPGIGFGKTTEQNIHLIKKADEFQIFKRPIMYGISNKSFIGNILNIKNPDKRVNGSVISSLFSIMNGVNIIRTHNVKETVEMIKLWRVFK